MFLGDGTGAGIEQKSKPGLGRFLDALTTVGSSKASPSTREDMEKEFTLYMSASANVSPKDPLVWWTQNCSVFPTLAKLAKKYLCAMATSVSSERLFSKSGNILSLKRNKINPEMAQKLVFLAANKF